ncbi:succinate dehydrogenase assembly factor 4, mitochondrial [Bombina bombina]|uniref:succinate dehydrogenase assembly factor 4, mitochondrial n=1 Tax=Bombina bombina TaxID=8345 RepID=UPI00235AD011|nr:succinate dehydrogenase assembly factor 4, mitochondrial [Bombina bombina]
MNSLNLLVSCAGSRAAAGSLISEQLKRCVGIFSSVRTVSNGSQENAGASKQPLKKPKTPQGRLDETEQVNEEKGPLERFPGDINPVTKEKGGPRGPEPTRYGDWERKGRCIDF